MASTAVEIRPGAKAVHVPLPAAAPSNGFFATPAGAMTLFISLGMIAFGIGLGVGLRGEDTHETERPMWVALSFTTSKTYSATGSSTTSGSATATVSGTSTASATTSPSVSATSTSSASASASGSGTTTPSVTATAIETSSGTSTSSASASESTSSTPSASGTTTSTASPSASPTSTSSPSPSTSSTSSSTSSGTPSPSVSAEPYHGVQQHVSRDALAAAGYQGGAVLDGSVYTVHLIDTGSGESIVIGGSFETATDQSGQETRVEHVGWMSDGTQLWDDLGGIAGSVHAIDSFEVQKASSRGFPGDVDWMDAAWIRGTLSAGNEVRVINIAADDGVYVTDAVTLMKAINTNGRVTSFARTYEQRGLFFAGAFTSAYYGQRTRAGLVTSNANVQEEVIGVGYSNPDGGIGALWERDPNAGNNYVIQVGVVGEARIKGWSETGNKVGFLIHGSFPNILRAYWSWSNGGRTGVTGTYDYATNSLGMWVVDDTTVDSPNGGVYYPLCVTVNANDNTCGVTYQANDMANRVSGTAEDVAVFNAPNNNLIIAVGGKFDQLLGTDASNLGILSYQGVGRTPGKDAVDGINVWPSGCTLNGEVNAVAFHTINGKTRLFFGGSFTKFTTDNGDVIELDRLAYVDLGAFANGDLPYPKRVANGIPNGVVNSIVIDSTSISKDASALDVVVGGKFVKATDGKVNWQNVVRITLGSWT